MRYFVNQFPNLVEATAHIDKHKWRDTAVQLMKSVLQRIPATFKNCDGGLYVGIAGVAYTLYQLSNVNDLSEHHQEYLKAAEEYISVALGYSQSKQCRDPPASFLLGTAGVYAVASAIHQRTGDAATSQTLANKYADLSSLLLSGDQAKRHDAKIYDELFVGRAGYLCGALFMEKALGRKVISDEIVRNVCSSIIESGRSYSRKRGIQSPLMYAYYNTEYLGAAHGLSSILQMLLRFPDILRSIDGAEVDVRQSVDFLLSLEQKDFNYPPAMDQVGDKNRQPESEQLIHWCHGAPGVVYLFARAYRVWQDHRYLEACVRCGDVIWEKGLLLKGPGICHGVAGNAYVFLLLYQLTAQQKYLHQAQKFAEFIMSPEFQAGARTPDSPYSLYEGWSGTICFLADILEPEKAAFPFFDV